VPRPNPPAAPSPLLPCSHPALGAALIQLEGPDPAPYIPGAAGLWLPSREPQLCPPSCPVPGCSRCPRSAVAPCCCQLLCSCRHEGSDIPVASRFCQREGPGRGSVRPSLLPAPAAGVRDGSPLGAPRQCLGHFYGTQQFGKTLISPSCSHRN